MEHVNFSKVDMPNPQTVIAGTFCLMSCAMRTGSNLYLPKIVDNLNYLSDCVGLDSSLRRLCSRISSDWESWLLENNQQLDLSESTEAQLGDDALAALPALLASHAESNLNYSAPEKSDAQQFVENLVAGRYHRA